MCRLLVFSVVCSLCLFCEAADKEKMPNESRPGYLEETLKKEAAGISLDRRADISHASVLNDEARWQIGQVQVDGNWINVETIAEIPKSKAVLQYASQRALASKDAKGQRALASWCQSNSLADQSRAHWYAVAALESDNLEARRNLGHKWIDGRWYNLEEQHQLVSVSNRLQEQWKTWMPKMRSIVNDLRSNVPQNKQRALVQLSAIDDPTAISSLEITCLQLPDDFAAPFIKAIKKLRATEACLACCRIALAYPDRPSSDLAVGVIKSYPQEFYVPELLDLLNAPVQTEMNYVFNSKGEMLIRRALFRETKDEKQIVRLERLVRVNAPTSTVQSIDGLFSVRRGYSKITSSTSLSRYASPNQIPADEIAASRNAIEDQLQFERQIREANIQSEQVSSGVFKLLAKTTGVSLEEKPDAWWNWWRGYNERYASRKPLRNFNYAQVDRAVMQVGYAQLGSTLQMSCLVRGTEIQTAEGLKPIESIQIGDMVLSQDVETGELALKPVLQTTVRPPKSTLRVVTASGEIQATAGHRWFVSGKGWLMTRELEPTMLLHNATGTTSIAQVIEDAEEQKTFNLVVDGFHTYFVGKDRVLSYDNSELKPTLRAVPGYGLIAQN